MVQSQNKKVDLTIKGTSYMGIASYGDIMIGDEAFEYYNEKNVKDFIQIPWDQVEYVSASVYFNKWISRFAIFVENGSRSFSFSSRDNKKVLRAINKYVPSNKLLKSPTFLGVIRKGLFSLFKKH
ncbi:hypothetical protein SAMN04487761_12920 [Lachnospiraceae bacterium C7]|nr:hypothetical protein SAMN04487761_12920 [Lachnospiraceae bacterium C7]